MCFTSLKKCARGYYNGLDTFSQVQLLQFFLWQPKRVPPHLQWKQSLPHHTVFARLIENDLFHVLKLQLRSLHFLLAFTVSTVNWRSQQRSVKYSKRALDFGAIFLLRQLAKKLCEKRN